MKRPALIAATLLLTPPASGQGEALIKGREGLQKNDLPAARAAYHEILPGQADYAAKLEDLMRHHLGAEAAVETWRITELARRTRTKVEHLDYYTALAATKKRLCTIGFAIPEDDWRYLVQAHLYRYPNRYQESRYDASPFDVASRGRLQSHLTPYLTHYLQDIPNATLLTGQGCRLSRGGFAARPTASAHELASLRAWYELRKPRKLDGQAAVEMRLVELLRAKEHAKNKDYQELAATILEPYRQMDAEGWLMVSEPERRYLWQTLVAEKMIEPPPYKLGDATAARAKLVIAILQGINTPDAGPWAGLLAFDALPVDKQTMLVDHLLTIAGLGSRPYLLAKRLDLHAAKGETSQALALIRRILLQGESEGDAAAETRAAQIAADLFSEYRYDERLLGAIHSALPTSLWASTFRRLLLEHALVGNVRGHDSLTGLLRETNGMRGLRFSAEEWALIVAMTKRDRAAYRRVLGHWTQQQLAGTSVNLASEIASRSLELSGEEYAAVAPYLVDLADYLKAYLRRGQRQQQLDELIHALDRSNKGDWNLGSERSRSGTVAVGVADLSEAAHLEYPFRWDAPARLNLRDLLVVPKNAWDREWVIR